MNDPLGLDLAEQALLDLIQEEIYEGRDFGTLFAVLSPKTISVVSEIVSGIMPEDQHYEASRALGIKMLRVCRMD